MEDNTEKYISFFCYHIKEYAEEATFFYLNTGYGMWKDSYGVEKVINSMSKKYIKNCIKVIEQAIEFVNSYDFRQLTKERFVINIKAIDTRDVFESNDVEVTDMILELVKNKIIEALIAKRKELNRYV